MRGFAISEKNENKYVNIHLVTRTRLSDCKTQMYSICPNPVWDYQMYLFVHSVRHTKAKLHPVCFIPTCSSVSFTIFHFYFDTYVLKRKKNHSPRDWLRFFHQFICLVDHPFIFGLMHSHTMAQVQWYSASLVIYCTATQRHSHASCHIAGVWPETIAQNSSFLWF